MPLPLATHSISVLERAEKYVDPGEAETWIVVASGVRAVIGSPGGASQERGGEQLRTTYSIQCDRAPISRLSRVKDEASGSVYNVEWIEPLPIFNAMTGSLSKTEGYV